MKSHALFYPPKRYEVRLIDAAASWIVVRYVVEEVVADTISDEKGDTRIYFNEVSIPSALVPLILEDTIGIVLLYNLIIASITFALKFALQRITKDFDFHLAKAYFAVALILVSALIGGTEGIPGTTPPLSYNGY